MRSREYTFTYKDRSRVKSLQKLPSGFATNASQILTPQPRSFGEINIEVHNDHIKFQKGKLNQLYRNS